MAKRYYESVTISADKSKMANMPQEVMIKKYPPASSYLAENLNDGLSGIDSQISKDKSKRNSNKQPEKY